MSSFKAGNSNYKAPAHKSTLSGGKAHMNDGDSSGVGTGLSALQAFDSEAGGPMCDYEKDSLTGNATERVEPSSGKSVSAKGKSFEIL